MKRFAPPPARRTLLLSTAVLIALATAAPRSVRAQTHNYIALGDSYAFGYTTPSTPASFGDQGYVAPFANSLAAQFGGVRPTVTNLAIPGETSTSLFTGAPTVYSGQSPLPDGLIDAPARAQALNQNYPAVAYPQFSNTGTPLAGNSQFAALQSSLSGIKGSGGTVNDITVQMGGNDILALFGQSAFTSLSATQQNAVLQTQLANLQARYTSLLSYLTSPSSGASGAQIFLIGYADPFAGLGANNPLSGGNPANPLSTQLTLTTNALIQGLATSFGVHYVDIYTPFAGHETQYTYIADPTLLPGGSPNYHPNATGYAVIAKQISTASAPEPSSAVFVLPALGCAGLCGRNLRGLRRQRSQRRREVAA